jgi:hypothetical protein
MAVGPRTVREEEETDIGPAGMAPLIRCGRVTKLLQESGGGLFVRVPHHISEGTGIEKPILGSLSGTAGWDVPGPRNCIPLPGSPPKTCGLGALKGGI